MKVGIDSYCYHRFFGEVYPQQSPPQRRLSLEDFLSRARELDVDGVSLSLASSPASTLLAWPASKLLDGFGFDRVYAWGHPDGLEGDRMNAPTRIWWPVSSAPGKSERM